MMTVSAGLNDTLANIFDAVPARKRQFLNARITLDREKGIPNTRVHNTRLNVYIGFLRYTAGITR